MASNQDFVDYVCEQIRNVGMISYKKMFGEYMVYCNQKPIILICDNTAFVKMRDELSELLSDASKGFPYKGAKEHHILDVDDSELMQSAAKILNKIVPLPKPKVKKMNK